MRTEATVVLTDVKYPYNLAAAIRAAACWGADRVLWTGARFEFKDGERLPREERMKGYSSVQVVETQRPLDWLGRYLGQPTDVPTQVVCVELTPTAMPLTEFEHSALGHSVYIFGPEDGGVSKAYRGLCREHVYIPAKHCLNLAAAVNVVLAHRSFQRGDCFSPAETEGRGIIEVPGWDGR